LWKQAPCGSFGRSAPNNPPDPASNLSDSDPETGILQEWL